jgi:hypothetical protein
VYPHAKGGYDRGMWITYLPLPSCITYPQLYVDK